MLNNIGLYTDLQDTRNHISSLIELDTKVFRDLKFNQCKLLS